ncbi:MAG: cysteine desulfurase [Bacteroidetes bacterium]|jgi:cysteine desulfurase|nr:cysteine desulfurase [Bacteroidota bacterium]
MINNLIYFDNNATTRVHDEVVKTMLPYFTENYGNAASRMHAHGWIAQAAVETAANQVAAMIQCEPSEIVFTSGATESVNLAIKGIFEAYRSKGNHIITCKTEHKAVLDVCDYLSGHGAEITYLDVDREGLIDTEELKAAITPRTILVSIMAANNETGVIQPLEKIGEICREHKVIFFSDATQFVGKQRCDVNELGVHCMAFSAHKFYGPKGIGALYIRRKDPRVNIIEQMHGGGHQNHKRSGTLNVPLIAGLGKAAELFKENHWDNSTHVSKLKNYFEHQLLDIEGLRINGSTRSRLYTTSNLTFPQGMKVASLASRFAFSSGSACSSGNPEPSHVLKAMHLTDEEIKNSFRFSFGIYNTLEEVKLCVEEIGKLNSSL